MSTHAINRALRAALVLGLLASGSVQADVLLIERVQAGAQVQLPERGLPMAEVERRFGAPAERLSPRGGQHAQWPAIHRWVYPQFTVYFERDRVVNSVLNQARPNEIGPRPAIR